jgi:hypothetical protein
LPAASSIKIIPPSSISDRFLTIRMLQLESLNAPDSSENTQFITGNGPISGNCNNWTRRFIAMNRSGKIPLDYNI